MALSQLLLFLPQTSNLEHQTFAYPPAIDVVSRTRDRVEGQDQRRAPRVLNREIAIRLFFLFSWFLVRAYRSKIQRRSVPLEHHESLRRAVDSYGKSACRLGSSGITRSAAYIRNAERERGPGRRNASNRRAGAVVDNRRRSKVHDG